MVNDFGNPAFCREGANYHRANIRSIKKQSKVRDKGIENYEWLINNSTLMSDNDNLFFFEPEEINNSEKKFFFVRDNYIDYNGFNLLYARNSDVIFSFRSGHTLISVVEALEMFREVRSFLESLVNTVCFFSSTERILSLVSYDENKVELEIDTSFSSPKMFDISVSKDMLFTINVSIDRMDVYYTFNELFYEHRHTNRIAEPNLVREESLKGTIEHLDFLNPKYFKRKFIERGIISE